MSPGFNINGEYEQDAFGYVDVEVSIDFSCEITENCGEWTEPDVMVDACGGHDVEATCPVCGELVTKFYSGDSEYEYEYGNEVTMFDRDDYDFF